MKRIILLILVLVLLLSTTIFASNNINIYIDNVLIENAKGTIVNGSTLVPLRAIFEALGASVDWDSKIQTVTSKKGDITIELTIGKTTARRNGIDITLTTPGQIINGVTMVPLRFIGEAFGGMVNWDGVTRSVYITTESSTEDKILYKVIEVIDGDTIKVMFNGKEEKVRLIGVDTPETKHPTKGIQPYGLEASEYTKNRLEEKKVRLEFDVQERDMYGRLLAYVWLDNEMFNATLVKEGYAQVSTFPPNVKYVDIFVRLQKEAREAGKGLWALDEYQDIEIEEPKSEPQTGNIIIITKDLEKEYIELKNNDNKTINLEGWIIVSVEGDQHFTLPSYDLESGTTVKIYSGTAAKNETDGIIWTTKYIWNNNGDSAKLLNPNGEIVSEMN